MPGTITLANTENSLGNYVHGWSNQKLITYYVKNSSSDWTTSSASSLGSLPVILPTLTAEMGGTLK
jgi:hypothetical protein